MRFIFFLWNSDDLISYYGGHYSTGLELFDGLECYLNSGGIDGGLISKVWEMIFVGLTKVKVVTHWSLQVAPPFRYKWTETSLQ